jgi:hypothetical protein
VIQTSSPLCQVVRLATKPLLVVHIFYYRRLVGSLALGLTPTNCFCAPKRNSCDSIHDSSGLSPTPAAPLPGSQGWGVLESYTERFVHEEGIKNILHNAWFKDFMLVSLLLILVRNKKLAFFLLPNCQSRRQMERSMPTR